MSSGRGTRCSRFASRCCQPGTTMDVRCRLHICVAHVPVKSSQLAEQNSKLRDTRPMNIRAFFPTYQDLEAAPVPAVAGALLKVLLPKVRGGEVSFHVHNETLEARAFYDGRWECARAISEAFGWLAARNLICLASAARSC